MRRVGLTAIESQIVSAVAPLGKLSFYFISLSYTSTFTKCIFIVTTYTLCAEILNNFVFVSAASDTCTFRWNRVFFPHINI
jgi:hypothetical protein